MVFNPIFYGTGLPANGQTGSPIRRPLPNLVGQGHELVHGEGFGAAAGIDAAGFKDGGRFGGVQRQQAGRKRVAQRLAALAEGGLDHPRKELFVIHRPFNAGFELNSQNRRIDLWAGMELGGAHVEQGGQCVRPTPSGT
jgi:hypothetical protein